MHGDIPSSPDTMMSENAPSSKHSSNSLKSISISQESTPTPHARLDSHLRKQHSIMKTVFCIFGTIIVAFLIPTQAGINILLSNQLNNPILTTLISFVESSIVISLYLCYDCKLNTLSKMKNWFHHLNSNKIEYLLLLNGPVAVINVIAVIYISPIIGFALYFMCVVAGQIISSSLIDIYQSTEIYKLVESNHNIHNINDNNDNNNKISTNNLKTEKQRMHVLTILSIFVILTGVIMFEINLISNDKHFSIVIICSLVSFAIGIIDIIKAAMNRRIKIYVESSLLTSAINFVNGTICIGIIAVIEYFLSANKLIGNNKYNIKWDEIDNSTWYMWFSGIMGLFWVTVITIIMPGYIGYSGTVICAIFGNFIASIIYDTFGVFGVKSTKLTWNRIAGAICVLIAVLLINVNKLLHSRTNNNGDNNNNNHNNSNDMKHRKTVSYSQSEIQPIANRNSNTSNLDHDQIKITDDIGAGANETIGILSVK